MANTDKEQEVVETAENVAEEATEVADDKMAELEKELAASKEAHIRTLAEYDNYRKRTAKEKENTWVDAKAVCITELLPMLDNFDRALGVTDSDFESYKKGVEMIYQGFCETLKKLGVEAFGEEGDEFDPNFHSAVMHVDDESLGENVLAQVFSKGYKLGEKVLRPAMVKVAN
ncbi:MAG: nucleotide exchange factor GrpE [Clostridia bacterium]|nr:nucleotide exchange factor GrpE [Clostridia bacterium]